VAVVIAPQLVPIFQLAISNVFMTLAWDGPLTFTDGPLWVLSA